MNEAEVIAVDAVGKRYTKYDDTPMLLTSVLRRGRRTRRSELWALRDATFSIAAGESVGVIGRNGSGKSTLLRMLAGVTAPTAGTVSVRGRVAPLISVGVGFHPELTGRENVHVNATVLGLGPRQISARFDEIVDFAGIADFIDTPVKFYSSGMFVRLGFAVAVHADPDVLLVDEVLAVGDVGFQLQCYERMQEIRRAGTTVVVVSHNLSAIRGMCARTLVVHDGEVRFDGDTPRAISTYHELLATDAPSNDGGTGDLSVDAHGVVEALVVTAGGEESSHVSSAEEMELALRVRFTRDVSAPLVGVNVVNEAGVIVYTDASGWTGEGEFRAGETVEFRVRLRPSLAAGSYTAQVGLSAPDGTLLVPAPEPVLFYVEGRNTVGGIADLRARFAARTLKRDG